MFLQTRDLFTYVSAKEHGVNVWERGGPLKKWFERWLDGRRVSLSVSMDVGQSDFFTEPVRLLVRSITHRNSDFPSSWPATNTLKLEFQVGKSEEPGQHRVCNPIWPPPLTTLSQSCALQQLFTTRSVFCVIKESILVYSCCFRAFRHKISCSVLLHVGLS